MKIAVSLDEYYPIIDALLEELRKRGHEIYHFGPKVQSDPSVDWPKVTAQAVEQVQKGLCDEAIVLCWTGTGACLVASKMNGIRAALCFDKETAEGAKKYNHANVLALSLRQLSADLLKEILDGWFETPYDQDDWNKLQVRQVQEIEARERGTNFLL